MSDPAKCTDNKSIAKTLKDRPYSSTLSSFSANGFPRNVRFCEPEGGGLEFLHIRVSVLVRFPVVVSLLGPIERVCLVDSLEGVCRGRLGRGSAAAASKSRIVAVV